MICNGTTRRVEPGPPPRWMDPHSGRDELSIGQERLKCSPFNDLARVAKAVRCHYVVWAILMLMATISTDADDANIKNFLSQHCLTCHGEKKQKADRRFDTLKLDLSEASTSSELGIWQDILDQLNLGDMPPESEPQPDSKQLKSVIASITKKIETARESSRAQTSQTVLRRLNRREYRNTIRDLFEFDMTLFDPTIGFPDDEVVDGFDNQGQALVTSSYLLENYLEAAEKIVSKAIGPADQPPTRQYRFRPPFDRTTNAHSGWVTQERRNTDEYQSIFQGTKERFGYRPLDDIQAGVPADGRYRVRVKACGLYRDHQYPDKQLIGTDPAEPIRLALVSGSQEFGTLHLRQANEQTLAVLDLPDDQPEWLTTEVWLDRGYQPRLTYQNGPYFFKSLPHPLHRRYPELFPVKLVYSNWWDVCQQIKTPQIRVYGVEIEGPLYDQWPPASHRIIFGDRPFTADRIPEIIESFATRAFRRPVRPDELDSLLQLVEQRRQTGGTAMEALQDGLIAVLCSPGFLYLSETRLENAALNSEPVKTPRLDDYSLASRLSYFLWSSMPDQELLQLAADQKLQNETTLIAQTKRMLADPKAEAFVEDFTDRWLTLYKLGQMPPDSQSFQHYFVGELERAMRRESQLFFQHLLDQNLDVGQFLDSDFTFVNRPLARHYRMDLEQFENQLAKSTQMTGDGFIKIQHNDPQRGGLFGQASVLTVTANGIDTSPVIRGVWVLENILGSPPPPPPEGIEPLEPDTRGSVSIRDQLKKHRNVESCSECHRKIDPLGFALENFDAIGGRRTFYDSKGKLRIDTSGKMPSGETFANVSELKQILKNRKRQFVHCLAEKMLAYACGRPMNVHDRPVVDRLVDSAEQAGDGLRDLVFQVVTSEAFLSE